MKVGRSWEVVVKVDGRPLEEFQMTMTDGGKRGSCFIASEAGKVRSDLRGCFIS
jgi:hypothetical protein